MTCAYGIHIVGRVLICYGVFDAIASVSFGFIIKKIGRIPIFLLGASINLAVFITLFSYPQRSDNMAGQNEADSYKILIYLHCRRNFFSLQNTLISIIFVCFLICFMKHRGKERKILCKK